MAISVGHCSFYGRRIHLQIRGGTGIIQPNGILHRHIGHIYRVVLRGPNGDRIRNRSIFIIDCTFLLFIDGEIADYCITASKRNVHVADIASKRNTLWIIPPFFCEGAFKMKTSHGNFPLMVLQKICIWCDRHQTLVVNGICADDLVGTVRIIHGNIFFRDHCKRLRERIKNRAVFGKHSVFSHLKRDNH